MSLTADNIYNTIGRSGKYALPYLVKFYHKDFGTIYLVNNNEDIVYNGITYKASSFKYTRPKTKSGVLQNGSIEATILDNTMSELVQKSDYLLTVDAIGVLAKDGTVTPFSRYHHQYGTATIDNDMKISFTFSNDDRLNMIFPPYIFDADNNRGNV